MNAKLKVVTQLPLAELWIDQFKTASRVRWLTADEIKSLLRVDRVQFVVADVGALLEWIPLDECYEFWKTEAQPHLATPESRASLDDFPNGYFYFASEWSNGEGAETIIVCERQH